MPFADASINTGLDALTLSHVAAHDDYPGLTGTNEVSGGAYARQTITMGAASARQRVSSGTPTIPIPAATTVEFISLWDSLTVGVFEHMTPLGSTGLINYSVDDGNDTIESPAHGLVNDQQVVFMGDTPPGGLTEGTLYWVVTATTDDFQVAATMAGAAITLTSASDDAMLSLIVPQTFSIAGNLIVSSYTVRVLAGQS